MKNKIAKELGRHPSTIIGILSEIQGYGVIVFSRRIAYMNGLIRQYVPKGTCMNSLTHGDVGKIMDKLNNRPRKFFGFKTSNQVLFWINPPIALAS